MRCWRERYYVNVIIDYLLRCIYSHLPGNTHTTHGVPESRAFCVVVCRTDAKASRWSPRFRHCRCCSRCVACCNCWRRCCYYCGCCCCCGCPANGCCYCVRPPGPLCAENADDPSSWCRAGESEALRAWPSDTWEVPVGKKKKNFIRIFTIIYYTFNLILPLI